MEVEERPPTPLPPPHASTTIAPPLYPQAQRLFNNSLLQLFSILRLGVVGSMGATNQQGVAGLAAVQKKPKKISIFSEEFC